MIFSFIHIDAQNWKETQKIVASDRSNDDIFGATEDISNNYAVVGAFLDSEDANGENTSIEAGSAYIFERDPSGIYDEVQKIVASDRDKSSFLV